MCGIIAVTQAISNEKMEKMMDEIEHRGPDEGDQAHLNRFHFAHQRLSIVGVEDGKQPIFDENDTKALVCNGEIYNYEMLKKELENKNTTFTTASDSEVVLRGYEKWGLQAIQKLDGMFAFVLADTKNNTYVAARDTLGIKPLYYGELEDGSLIFASELKSIYALTDQVDEFPPGYYYTPDDGFVCYRMIEPVKKQDQLKMDRNDLLAGIRHHLQTAVKKRMMADVPVGVLLSGGLDSSLISAIAMQVKEQREPLHSFCVGFEGSPDLKAARDVADAIGTIHHEYVYTKEELIEALPKVIYHLESYDPSLVRSAIPCYFVSQLASRYVKVVLSGEGADELFSGYDYLQQINDTEKLSKELVRIINTLHNINLQRLDRMSMAHSLEGRVPFLDLDFVKYALKIPAQYKQSNDDLMEKAILRESFTETLPEHILWRKKAEFSEGSGALDILEAYAEEEIDDVLFKQTVEKAPVPIRSKQECLYYLLFRQDYGHDSALDTVGHWATS
ncbi:asparagine synthase B [Texcoconibacillus texcoconensis]|uniref:asparagine synthase (glutamine-hydrolyzing) n=1 Tax=Texcoconibacillus texcoconensis TaxID=1095777 RepID=A0A840QPR2_9BACI|nr:asparagine synthase B [Texcoconibacillus texcoconensis]MBB5173321.1 asparagine synthase (glutamine-hydrolyzing) [Texcoconibacillus texcoconensis]